MPAADYITRCLVSLTFVHMLSGFLSVAQSWVEALTSLSPATPGCKEELDALLADPTLVLD